jgi:hypothetical protein
MQGAREGFSRLLCEESGSNWSQVWVADSAGSGLGFFVRRGSRILRAGAAKKPDVIGLFGFNEVEGKNARERAFFVG